MGQIARRAEVPFREVEAAVREHVTSHQADGVFTVDPDMATTIGTLVGFDQTMAEYTWDRGRAWDRFMAQLRRAFDKMTADAVLRKAAAGKPGPSGRVTDRRDVRYYTPAAWDAAADEARQRAAAEHAAELALDSIHARLERLGLAGVQSRGEWFRMPPEDWRRLLNLAEGLEGNQEVNGS